MATGHFKAFPITSSAAEESSSAIAISVMRKVFSKESNVPA